MPSGRLLSRSLNDQGKTMGSSFFRNVLVFLLFICSTFLMMLHFRGMGAEPVPCICHCPNCAVSSSLQPPPPSSPSISEDGRATIVALQAEVARLRSALLNCEDKAREQQQYIMTQQNVPPPPPPPPPQQETEEKVVNEGAPQSALAWAPPAPIDLELAEAALTRHYKGRWSGGGRQEVLCYANNNQQFIDPAGVVSHQWDIPTGR